MERYMNSKKQLRKKLKRVNICVKKKDISFWLRLNEMQKKEESMKGVMQARLKKIYVVR